MPDLMQQGDPDLLPDALLAPVRPFLVFPFFPSSRVIDDPAAVKVDEVRMPTAVAIAAAPTPTSSETRPP